MKSKTSFLAIMAFALNVNYVCASECVGEDCELTSIEILEQIQDTAGWTQTYEPACETQSACEHDYNCPFDSAEACAIWHKKPVYKATLAPRAPHINSALVDDMIYALHSNIETSANDSEMFPLVQRYKMLMNASDACCTAGIIYKMRQNGADDSAVYEFLKDDANHFAVTKRCLVMNDEDIASRYSNGVNGEMVADVRNACLCKNHQWFDSLLQPFSDLYESVPGFEESDFVYTYIDGMQREISVSMNQDVQNTIGLLKVCPK